MKRPSVFYVTENGTTRYGMTRSYGGLAGIILRLLTHATDGYGISIPYFERLKPMKEISEDEFQTYADHPETADDLYSFAEIDVDKNVLRIDEDWKEERSYREYPVPFPVSWTVKMKKKQKETQDILSYHSQAAGCSDKARAKASGGRQPIEECGRTGL